MKLPNSVPMVITKKTLSKKKKEELELHDSVIADKIEQIRFQNKFSRYYHDDWIKTMLDMIRITPKKILDYGCGNCLLYPHIKKRYPNAEYDGIDLSERMLEAGKQRFGSDKNFNVSQQDGEQLDFKDGLFDLIICRGSLHHLPDPSKGLQEMHRILAKGGELIITEPVSNIVVKSMRKLLYKKMDHFSGTHRSFTHKEFMELLKKEKFSVEKTKYYGLTAFPFAYPDIIPSFNHIPYAFPRTLAAIDAPLMKIPVIRSFSFVYFVLGRKQ